MPENNNNLAYKVENKRKGVLGTLEGVCADCIKATRNGRLYPDAVWQTAFNDPIVKEHFQCGGIFGQLGHPKEDQTENEEFNSIAICMPDPPKKGPDGKLRGRWDILDTPNGRILKCLCDYGYKIGISSRANGDVEEDWDGNESVVPDTFQFKAFDAVLLPAVKEARLNLVTESFDDTKDKLRKALKESIDSSDDVDKAVMLKTLEDLGIDYIESSENKEDNVVDNDELENDVAVEDGMELVSSLQAALKEIDDLKTQLFDLNEKLSVSDAKELRFQNQISKLKEALEKSKGPSNVAQATKNQLLSLKEQVEKLVVENQRQKKLTESYKNKLTKISDSKTQLTESVNNSDRVIHSLQDKIQSLNESLEAEKSANKDIVESLKQELTVLKQDSQVKNSRYTKQLKESQKVIKQYKNLAKMAVDKYIDCVSTGLGISASDVKTRLTEPYSFEQIDSVCESLRGYNLNISRLPFQLNNIKEVSMKENLQQRAITNPDDVVDSSILEFI